MVKPTIPPKQMLFLRQPEPPILISIHLFIVGSLSSLLCFADSLSFSTGALSITAECLPRHRFQLIKARFLWRVLTTCVQQALIFRHPSESLPLIEATARFPLLQCP